TKVTYPDNSFERYSFDASGNRTDVATSTATNAYVVNQLDQFTQAGAVSLQYDPDGNLARRVSGSETNDYTWDEDNRLIHVRRNGQDFYYGYDHEGRLTEKIANGFATRYVWDSRDLIGT